MNLSTALFIIIGLAGLWFVFSMQRNNAAFDYADFLMTRGHADPHKLLLLMGGVVSTWVVFHLAFVDKLTEGVFGLYIGAVVVNAGIQKGVGLIRDTRWSEPERKP